MNLVHTIKSVTKSNEFLIEFIKFLYLITLYFK